MSVMLSDADAAAFLARHPEVQADSIPTYGQQVYDNGEAYLIGINHNTGQVKVLDLGYTSADANVAAIQQVLDEASSVVTGIGGATVDTLSALLASITGGVAGAAKPLTDMLTPFLIVGGLFLVWQIFKEAKR